MLDLNRNTANNRFELLRDGAPIATLSYSYAGDATVLEHINVDKRYRGQGIAERFAEATLDELRAAQEAVIPQCPFVRGYMIRNPQWQELVPPDHRADLRS